jgi:hypothetical protein
MLLIQETTDESGEPAPVDTLQIVDSTRWSVCRHVDGRLDSWHYLPHHHLLRKHGAVLIYGSMYSMGSCYGRVSVLRIEYEKRGSKLQTQDPAFPYVFTSKPLYFTICRLYHSNLYGHLVVFPSAFIFVSLSLNLRHKSFLFRILKNL